MSHTLRRGVLAAALAGAFILAVPAAASAHVGVSPDRIPPGESTLLTFSFSHGCGESPTTALRVTMPEGIGGAWPTFDSDWSADIERTTGDKVSAVTFTAVKPVPQGLRGMVGLTVITDKYAADELVFPVEQRCVTGTNEWTQVAKDGEDPHSLDAPAPVVSLTEADEVGATGHGEHDAAAAAGDAYRSTSALPLILGGGGLAVGIAALVLAIGAYRRR